MNQTRKDELRKELFEITDEQTAELVLAILSGDADPEEVSPSTEQWVRDCYHRPSSDELRLHAADALLGNLGVEGFELPTGDFLTYSNAGDSYAATVVLRDGQFHVSSWADELERFEREHEEETGEERCGYCGEYGSNDTRAPCCPSFHVCQSCNRCSACGTKIARVDTDERREIETGGAS